METHYARFDSELGSVFTSLLSTAGGRESEQFQLLSQEYSQSQQSMASVLRNESLNLQKSLDKVNALIYKYAALKAAVETFEKDDAQCAYYRTKMKGLEEMRDRAAEKGKELGEKDRERLARNSQTLLEYQCKIAQIDPILRKALADCWTHRLDAMGHLFMATITAQNDILLRLSALSKETCSSQAVTALDPQL